MSAQCWHIAVHPQHPLKMKLKKGPFRLFMKFCALIGHMIFSKPFAVIAAVVLIYVLGGLTGHKAADRAIAVGAWCSDKWNGVLKETAVAFRLEQPSEETDTPQEYVPRAVIVDGIITSEGNEQYFLDDGSVLPPPDRSEAQQWQVNLPAR